MKASSVVYVVVCKNGRAHLGRIGRQSHAYAYGERRSAVEMAAALDANGWPCGPHAVEVFAARTKGGA